MPCGRRLQRDRQCWECASATFQTATDFFTSRLLRCRRSKFVFSEMTRACLRPSINPVFLTKLVAPQRLLQRVCHPIALTSFLAPKLHPSNNRCHQFLYSKRVPFLYATIIIFLVCTMLAPQFIGLQGWGAKYQGAFTMSVLRDQCRRVVCVRGLNYYVTPRFNGVGVLLLKVSDLYIIGKPSGTPVDAY